MEEPGCDKREREMFYLTTHSTHCYGYMVSDIWLRTILIVRKETRCRHSYQLTARVLLYAPSHRQDNTYYGLCYTSRGALAGTRNSSMGGCDKCLLSTSQQHLQDIHAQGLRSRLDESTTISLYKNIFTLILL